LIHLITKENLSLPDILVENNCDQLLNFPWSRIAVDTETTSLLPFDGKLLTIQLGCFEHQWLLDINSLESIPDSIKNLLQQSELIFHNAKFDFQWLYHHELNVKNINDTFLAECILTTGYENRKVGLKDVALKYLNIEISKDDRGLIHRYGLTSRVVEYCAKDVRYLHQILDKQLEQIEKHNLGKVYTLECQAVRPIALMEYHGVRLDTKKWLEVAEITANNVKSATKALDELVVARKVESLRPMINTQLNLFGFEERAIRINWGSNQDKLKVLRALGHRVDNVADKTLQRFKKKDEIFRHLITLSKNQKLSSSFGVDFLKFINKNTNRIHGSFWQILHGGRLSMSNPK